MTPPSLFTTADYAALAAIVFRDDYPGFATARGIIESPNGDGARDSGKRYSHVAWKYLEQLPDDFRGGATLEMYLHRAWIRSLEIATLLGVPEKFRPSHKGCLRVLEYPAGTGASAVHTDMDLFTLNLYRNVPNPGLPNTPDGVFLGELGEMIGLCPATPHRVDPLPVVQQSLAYFAMPDHAAVLPSGETAG